jgi:hypothetical protein
MIALTKGRNALSCRNNIGGIKNVYLFKFVEYNVTQIVRSGQEVTSFPNTEIYEFWTNNANFNETVSNDASGYKLDQNLTFSLLKTDLVTSRQLDSIKDIYFSCIITLNDGTHRILGLYNGLNLTYSDNSNGTKEQGTRYDITLTGSETISAPYLDNLNDFTIAQYLLLENGDFLLLEDGNKITLE